MGGWTAVAAGGVDDETVSPILLLAMLAITASLVTIAANRTLSGERLPLASARVSGLGAVVFDGGIVTGAWWLAAGGMFSVLAGTVLVAVGILISSWIPPSYGWGAIAASLALFVANSEN